MRGKRTRILVALLGLALAAAIGWWGTDYWRHGRFIQSTDDAYLKADYTIVAPKVSGYIAEVLVQDNQQVKAGQVLARIDDRDYAAALDQAKAEVDAAAGDIRSMQAQITMQAALVEQAKAAIAADQATAKFAQQENQRYQKLLRTGYGTSQQAEQAAASLKEQTANIARDQAALVSAQRQIDVLHSQQATAEAKLERVKAMLEQAELNLGYTTITAPIDGTIGSRMLRVGQYVQAGTELMAVVPLQSVYVVANYKETQLTRVVSGQAVEIQVDSFPGVVLHGHVDSIAPASGQEFALLPPDNATGNFTKIVQRVPVRIALDPKSVLLGRLRPGMSVEASIDTKPEGMAVAATNLVGDAEAAGR
jgi:membrane fusion protein, multidrug efflux system